MSLQPEIDDADDALLESQRFGMTPREVARRYRVSPDKARAWIRKGELRAVNTATGLGGKPRWVVLPQR